MFDDKQCINFLDPNPLVTARTNEVCGLLQRQSEIAHTAPTLKNDRIARIFGAYREAERVTQSPSFPDFRHKVASVEVEPNRCQRVHR